MCACERGRAREKGRESVRGRDGETVAEEVVGVGVQGVTRVARLADQHRVDAFQLNLKPVRIAFAVGIAFAVRIAFAFRIAFAAKRGQPAVSNASCIVS